MTLKEAKKKYEYFFIEYEGNSVAGSYEEYVSSDEIDDFIINHHVKNIYGTYLKPLEMDAEYIVENACEESYEDCYDDVLNSGGMERLQKYLDAWCKKYGRPSYEVDNDAKVV